MLTEDLEIVIVDNGSAALTAGQFPHDAERHEMAERGGRGRCRHPNRLGRGRDGGDRLLLQRLVDTQGRRRRAAQALDATAIFLELRQDAPGRVGRLIGGLRHALQEEVEPLLPRAMQTHRLEQFVVALTVDLEE